MSRPRGWFRHLRALGALDRLELVVLPMLFGAGMQLTPAVSTDTGLALESQRALPAGSVEIVYSFRSPRPAATSAGTS